MEIIKHGNVQNKFWYGKCPVCGAIIKLENFFINAHKIDFHVGDNYLVYRGNCPDCEDPVSDTKIYFYRGDSSEVTNMLMKV